MVDAWRKPFLKGWMKEAFMKGDKEQIALFSPEILKALEEWKAALDVKLEKPETKKKEK